MKKTIYYGGSILTMAEPLYAEAVLVEDGVIQMVGNEEDVMKRQDVATEMVDLMGRCLMPAFIDSHSHITALAQTMGLVQLAETVSMEEITERLANYKKQNKIADGEWIIGFGYDNNFLPDRRQPDKRDLDVFDRNPVLISHASGHMGVVNSLGLKALGITEETPDPEGGRIGRLKTQEGGEKEPNGFLEENAFFQRAGSMLVKDPEKELDDLSAAQDVYLKYGITTVQDGLLKADGFRLLKKAGKEGRLKLDVVGYPEMMGSKSLTEEKEYVKQYHNRLKLGGYKIILDGSPQGRTAWVTVPYEHGDGYCGYPSLKDQEVEQFVEEAYLEDMQILAHCNGDAAADQYLNAVAKAAGTVKDAGGREKDIRPVMIHAQLARRSQVKRMAEFDMIPSFFAAHTYYWGDTHIINFGRERAEHISPVQTAVREGVCYTLHQDTPVIAPNMLETVWCAVNRVTKSGVKLSGGEEVSCLDALKGVTVNAAYQYFEENEKGTIETGKKADFVILSEDPIKADPKKIKGIEVLETIKEDVTVYRREKK